MLSVILLILKIIGIVLLSFIGLVLFLILLILFVPIRYKVNASYEGEKISAKSKISWLLHIVSMCAGYENELYVILRLFGIRIKNKKEKKRVKKLKRRKKKTAKKSGSRDSKAESEKIEYTFDRNEDTPADSYDTDEADNISEDVPDDEYEYEYEYETVEEEIGLHKKIKEFFTAAYRFLAGIPGRVTNIGRKITGKKDFLDRLTLFIEDEKNKDALSLLWDELNRVLKNARPKDLNIKIHFGCDNPADTGQVLALLSIVYPLLADSLDITPEFDEVLFEAQLYARGRITVFVLIRSGMKIYFSKNFKHLKRSYKKLMK